LASNEIFVPIDPGIVERIAAEQEQKVEELGLTRLPGETAHMTLDRYYASSAFRDAKEAREAARDAADLAARRQRKLEAKRRREQQQEEYERRLIRQLRAAAASAAARAPSPLALDSSIPARDSSNSAKTRVAYFIDEASGKIHFYSPKKTRTRQARHLNSYPRESTR